MLEFNNITQNEPIFRDNRPSPSKPANNNTHFNETNNSITLSTVNDTPSIYAETQTDESEYQNSITQTDVALSQTKASNCNIIDMK